MCTKLCSYRLLDSVVSNSSGTSSVPPVTRSAMLQSMLPGLRMGVSKRTRDLLQDVLDWRLLPVDAPGGEPSMVWGATHLARLIVKLADFLNATGMKDEKMKTLLKYLNSFIE